MFCTLYGADRFKHGPGCLGLKQGVFCAGFYIYIYIYIIIMALIKNN